VIQHLAPKIKIISAERIRDELVKLFAPPGAERMNGLVDEWMSGERPHGSEGSAQQSINPTIHQSCGTAARGLVLLRNSGLLAEILPELAATVTCDQSPDFHPEGSVFNHVGLMLEKMPPDADELLPWTVLLHDIAKPVTAERDAATGKIHFYGHEKIGAEMAEQILRRLKFSNQQIETVVACVKHHMQFKDVTQMRKATLRRLLLRETFPLELELHRLDCLGSNGSLEHYDFCVAAAEQTGHPTAAVERPRPAGAGRRARKKDRRGAARNPRAATGGGTHNAGGGAQLGGADAGAINSNHLPARGWTGLFFAPLLSRGFPKAVPRHAVEKTFFRRAACVRADSAGAARGRHLCHHG
jgi:putative nucleotidyltransferase with HDIG domain